MVGLSNFLSTTVVASTKRKLKRKISSITHAVACSITRAWYDIVEELDSYTGVNPALMKKATGFDVVGRIAELEERYAFYRDIYYDFIEAHDYALSREQMVAHLEHAKVKSAVKSTKYAELDDTVRTTFIAQDMGYELDVEDETADWCDFKIDYFEDAWELPSFTVKSRRLAGLVGQFSL